MAKVQFDDDHNSAIEFEDNRESDSWDRNAAQGFDRDRTITIKYDMKTLWELIKNQDSAKGDTLASNQKQLYELKREISICSKKNFNAERDIFNLDKKISLLIKNRITLEEVMASSGDINTMLLQRTTTINDKREREQYGQLCHLLQRETVYMATLARLLKLGEIDNLLQCVMFTLYGNQYDDEEEHLLLSMFQRVLQEEFAEATGIGNLLRANTALTRMMTTYTRRGPGQTYLKQTLSGILGDLLNDKDLALEINPLKVYEQMINDFETQTGQPSPLPKKVSPEEANENKQVKDLIRPRLEKLDELANNFIDAVVGSIDQVPYGIRWICKQIRQLAREKFKGATTEQICSLIGGFFLLRFINPAVVTPQAFMLVETKLSANTRRNLTLLAKILQNLANNTRFGGVKEFYMAPLNDFLNGVRLKLNRFLEDLTRVDDLDDHLQLDKYLRLGKTSDSYIHISLNEMYFLHSLLLQYIKELTAKSHDNALQEILNELGPAPPQLPRQENLNVDLLLINRYQRSEESKEMKPEQMYTETKYLLFTVIKSLPKLEIEHLPNGNSSEEADIRILLDLAAKDFKLSENVAKIHANVKKLVADGYLLEADKYSKLRRDTVQQLVNYDAQITKSATDIERLKAVLRNIKEHNEFLKQQFEAYKQYLDNVREQCSTSTSTSSADKKQDKSMKKKGPFKFSHTKLQQDGIITETDVPEERRGSIYFTFTQLSPGVFNVAVSYKSRNISDVKLHLDDLLERQHNNNLEFETEFLKLNVNLLIFLLNKTFMS